jgi:uncharacterized protein
VEQRLENLLNFIHEQTTETKDPSHDFLHISRVYKWALRIGQKESADLRVLLPAALLHDLVNLSKDHPHRAKASSMSAAAADRILLEHNYLSNDRKKICDVIIEHSFSLGKKPSCLESGILQDADRLDALGAIGIMRMVTCGCLLSSVYYHAEDPFAKERPIDDKTYTIDHMYKKLFKLPQTMNTEMGIREANERVKFMELFIQQLGHEVTTLPREGDTLWT